MKDNASEQIDFMCTELEKNQLRTNYMEGDHRVPLTFYHKLARILINITIETTSKYDKITELYIEGVHKKAVFKPDHMHHVSAWERPLLGSPLRLIGNVYVDKLPADGRWYSPDGRPQTEPGDREGLYLRGGEKVLIRRH